MYQITETVSKATHPADSIIEVAFKNGTYIEANSRHPAQGFCALIPVEIQQPVYPKKEDGTPDMTAEPVGVETVKVQQNKVFHYQDKPLMKGDEPDATYTELQGVSVITELETDLEQAYELLYGGN